MQKNNSVIFKGNKDGIVIILSEYAGYDDIVESLRKKIRSSKNFFADAQTIITFKGKQMSESEIFSLIEIINEETNLSISFVEDLTGTFKASKEGEDDEVEDTAADNSDDYLYVAKNTSKKPGTLDEFVTDGAYFHRTGLRSGQAISHNGSVVVLGDINAGAEIIATGNVVVFGAIRGLVHAGAEGDETSFVCALSLLPTQLRIADRITYFPPELIKEKKNKIDPVYAFVKDDEIYVSPIVN